MAENEDENRNSLADATWVRDRRFQGGKREGVEAAERYTAHSGYRGPNTAERTLEITPLAQNETVRLEVGGYEGSIYLGLHGRWAEAYVSEEIIEAMDGAEFGTMIKALEHAKNDYWDITFDEALYYLDGRQRQISDYE